MADETLLAHYVSRSCRGYKGSTYCVHNAIFHKLLACVIKASAEMMMEI
jgi:hypothetical protein